MTSLPLERAAQQSWTLRPGSGRLPVFDRLVENGVNPPRADDLPDDPGARLYALSRWVPMGEADRHALLAAPGPDERLAVLTEAIATAIDLAEWQLKDQ